MLTPKQKFSAYLELTKPRITMLVLVTTTIGFYLGGKGFHSFSKLLALLIGSGFVCAGAAVLNHYLEWEEDGQMNRTKSRPIPTGKVSLINALAFGIILILAGLIVLYTKTNLLTAFLSLLTAFLYVLVYTPMKKISWLNTTIGSIPGALPPLGGWAAATNNLDIGGWALFLILFIWQHPHFYAIAWMFKEDYAKAGFKMLPVIEPNGKSTFQQVIIFSCILIPISLMPYFLGISGKFYLIGTTLAGIVMLWIATKFTIFKNFQHARNLLKATVLYLPVLLILIIMDVSF